MSDAPRSRVDVLGVPIDQLGWDDALGRIAKWAAAHESRVVCICNVHSVVTARSDASFRAAVLECDLATPDGAPVAWWIARRGGTPQPRLNGPDLMWRYCEQAAARGEGIFLYGATPATLATLAWRLQSAFPGLRIVGRHAPPFRPTTEEEDASVARLVADSGAGTLWVSLGCPKQELWMARQRGRIPAVMLGVGAAFDYHAGTLRRAPPWMQRHGLEWLHRLASEPRRLWRRYLVTNSRFIAALAWQAWRERFAPNQRSRN
jgi:N-acetylglucosaminyldiphosphoundecaprenol N-acetyl-beta-D-mannosaminyltransferase